MYHFFNIVSTDKINKKAPCRKVRQGVEVKGLILIS